MTFIINGYTVNVLRAMDQFNDYSIKYDITVKIQGFGYSWIQLIVARGDSENAIKSAFQEYLNNGWIKPE